MPVVAARKTGRPAGRPVGTTGVQMDARRHRIMIRDQARILRKEQKAIEAHVIMQRAKDETWLMPKEMIERAEMIGQFLCRAPAAVARNQQMLDEAETSIPTAQLEAQLRYELLRAAASYSDEDWKVIDDLRAQKHPGRWVADTERKVA